MADEYPKSENLNKPSPRNGWWLTGMLIVVGIFGLLAILVL